MNMSRITAKNLYLSKMFRFRNRLPANRLITGYTGNREVIYNQQCRLSHHKTFKYPDIPSEITARNLILRLDDKGRSLLFKELEKYQEEKTEITIDPNETVDVPKSELWKVFWFNGIPFIGFGLLDNMIMILAGEYIDVTLGAAFGISTMAAAALGNLISDVVGIGSAGYIELLVSKIGVNPPDISPEQALSWKSRWTSAFGRALGIIVGCLIGMFPLLFIDVDKDSKKDVETAEKASSTTPQTEVAHAATQTSNQDSTKS